jgi:uncharacterized membrane protein
MRETMLILHFIGLAMGLGVSFTHAFLGPTLSKLNKLDAQKFQSQTKALGTMGTIGTLLLLGSGIYLILPYWSAIAFMPMLIAKLTLFVLLMILITIINWLSAKDLKNDVETNKKGIEVLGKLTLLVAVGIVILAVQVFH